MRGAGASDALTLCVCRARAGHPHELAAAVGRALEQAPVVAAARARNALIAGADSVATALRFGAAHVVLTSVVLAFVAAADSCNTDLRRATFELFAADVLAYAAGAALAGAARRLAARYALTVASDDPARLAGRARHAVAGRHAQRLARGRVALLSCGAARSFAQRRAPRVASVRAARFVVVTAGLGARVARIVRATRPVGGRTRGRSPHTQRKHCTQTPTSLVMQRHRSMVDVPRLRRNAFVACVTQLRGARMRAAATATHTKSRTEQVSRRRQANPHPRPH